MSYFDGHLRDLGEVPAEMTRALLQRLQEITSKNLNYWADHDEVKPNKFGPFEGNVQHIVLAFPSRLWRTNGAKFYPCWSEWSDVVQPIIDHVTKHYGYKSGRVNRIMLAKLLPSRAIGRHIDSDITSEVPHKIHVPLITNPRVEFWEADSIYHLEVGRAYEVNNRISHGGANFGEEARVHLIFDYFDPASVEMGSELDVLASMT